MIGGKDKSRKSLRNAPAPPLSHPLAREWPKICTKGNRNRILIKGDTQWRQDKEWAISASCITPIWRLWRNRQAITKTPRRCGAELQWHPPNLTASFYTKKLQRGAKGDRKSNRNEEDNTRPPRFPNLAQSFPPNLILLCFVMYRRVRTQAPDAKNRPDSEASNQKSADRI